MPIVTFHCLLCPVQYLNHGRPQNNFFALKQPLTSGYIMTLISSKQCDMWIKTDGKESTTAECIGIERDKGLVHPKLILKGFSKLRVAFNATILPIMLTYLTVLVSTVFCN